MQYSLAGLLRHEYNTSSASEMKQRTQILFNLASRLKWISNTFNICIVVVNQVTASFDTNLGCPDSIPSLGLAWSQCVNLRISLKRDTTAARSAVEYSSDGEVENTSSKIKLTTSPRVIMLIGCPYKATPVACSFYISDGGIFGQLS